MLLGAGGVAKKTYMDDLFSTHLYKGNATARTITNGIDLAGEGGLVWTKARDSTTAQNLIDTVRGNTKRIRASSNGAETTITDSISAFNSNGYSLAVETSSYGFNLNNVNYSSWTFRKAKGFFDIVSYTGNGSARTIAHSLGSIPGMIIVKRTATTADWRIYYRGSDGSDTLKFDTGASVSSPSSWDATKPTATHFSLGTQVETNANGGTFIAYLFAGGESTAATATSVVFSGQEGINVPASSDLNLATSNFTIEGWVYVDNAPGTGAPSYGRFFQLDGPTVNDEDTNLQITIQPSDHTIYVQHGPNQLISGLIPLHKKWNHIALTRDGNTFKIYVNGINDGTATTAQSMNPNSGSPRVRLGYAGDTSTNNGVFEGKVSNFRITVGQILYSSDFIPPTEPLTTTSQGATASNVKLLCCNGSTTTSATVTPGTITEGGSPAASTDSPFSDPAAYIYGENEDKDIIKCGSYVGDGGTGKTEIYLGWEPQWLLVRAPDDGDNWVIIDIMRGFVTHENQINDAGLLPNTSDAESTQGYLDVTSTGFKTTLYSNLNVSGRKYIYMAIRRPDGYVGKPAEAGTDVFAIDAPNSNSAGPIMESPFPVDFGIAKVPTSTGSWYTSARLIQGNYVVTDSNSKEASYTNFPFDYQNGWISHSSYQVYQSWMWKRHAGFDVMTWKGNNRDNYSDARFIPHNLNKIPEMVWIKYRFKDGSTYGGDMWYVWHKGLNGGSNSHNYRLSLNSDGAEASSGDIIDSATSATHLGLRRPGGDASATNDNNANYLAMLFASVDGISKVGSFDGQNSDLTVTFGFQPRFLMVKRRDSTGDWNVYDTTRGLVSGADKELRLNNTSAQSDHELGDVTSTGFTFACSSTHDTCQSGAEYIYYAHA